MGSFSSLIDVSSFFIGILINLLLVAMICYYFKRKIDNLEMSQSEQAKMMYSLLQQREQENAQPSGQASTELDGETSVTEPLSRKNMMLDLGMSTHSYLNNLDLNSLDGNKNVVLEDTNNKEEESDTESESGSDADSLDEETVEEELSDVEDENETSNLKMIEVDDPGMHMTKPYEKMTVKELKQIIEQRGIQLTKKTMKKNEYIDILMNNTNEEESEEEHGENEVLSVEVQSSEKEEQSIRMELEDEVESNDENENIIESMQSQVESVLRRSDTINPRTFSLDLNLDAEVDVLPET